MSDASLPALAALTRRLEIIESLLIRLLNEQAHVRPQPPPLPPPPSLTAPTLPASAVIPLPFPPEPPPSPAAPAYPPHPDWLPVLHRVGCGQPGVYLLSRVDGTRRASPAQVRILPRVQDPQTGLWISEPWREPHSDDLVRCAGCGLPIDLWSNRDLDYRPHLDNEIGQPMYPAQTAHLPVSPPADSLSAPPVKEVIAAHPGLAAKQAAYAAREAHDEEQLLRLKEQAQILREQVQREPVGSVRPPAL